MTTEATETTYRDEIADIIREQMYAAEHAAGSFRAENPFDAPLTDALDVIEQLIAKQVSAHHNAGVMHRDCGDGAIARAWGAVCPACPQQLDFFATLPAVDEFGVPTAKMPNCPSCGADELGMISPSYVLCYACRFQVSK